MQGDKVYDFDTQLAIGQAGEEALDVYFSKWYGIEPVDMELQMKGIDRIFTRKFDELRLAVEYKTDFVAAKTGNAFVETELAFTTGTRLKGGWARTCQADFLVYWPVGLGPITLNPLTLRTHLDGWETQYQGRTVQNPTWVSVGILVPLRELRLLAVHVGQPMSVDTIPTPSLKPDEST